MKLTQTHSFSGSGSTFLAGILILLIFLLIVTEEGFSQVAINTDGSNPNSKAMLDISATNMGILIPRMTTAQRTSFAASLSKYEEGMMVFDTQTNTLYYYDGNDFNSISNGVISLLQDADGDTKVEVEESTDEDVIRFFTGGTEYFSMEEGRLNVTNTGNSVFIGQDAGANDDLSQNFNIAIGANSLSNNETIGYTVAIGDSALFNNGTGSFGSLAQFNTAVGSKSQMHNTRGHENTSLGFESLYENTSGQLNTAIGSSVLHNNTLGSASTACGSEALSSNTTGNYNTALGVATLYENTEGEHNLAIGYLASSSNISGNANIAIGTRALALNESIGYTIAIGDSALFNNGTGSLSGNEAKFNTAVGSKSQMNNIEGFSNTSLGFESLKENTIGAFNTAIGAFALHYNTEGYALTACGDNALYNNSTGIGSTAYGYSALLGNTTGDYNIALGYFAGATPTQGNGNIIIGNEIDIPNATGDNQLIIGNLIYANDIDGTGTSYSSGNVGIGVSNPSYKLDVRGNDMQLKSSTGGATVYLDGTSGNSTISFEESNSFRGSMGYNMTDDYLFLYEGGNAVLKNGNFGIGTTTPGYRLQVGNSGDGSTARANAWNTFSDMRWKTNIVVIDNPIEKLNILNGYYYNWKEGEDSTLQIGVIAQEVEMALPEIVSTDSEGYKSVDYSKLTALLIEVNKEQQLQLASQQEQIDELNIKMQQQRELIDQLISKRAE
jgi:hypothetical protein